MTKKINTSIDKYLISERNSLLDLLMNIQDNEGFLSEEALTNTSRKLGIPATNLYGIISFYDQFRLVPKGKYHIKICDGLRCHFNNNNSLLKEIEKKLNLKIGQTSRDGKFSLEKVTCFSPCTNGFIISINEEYYTESKQEKIIELISRIIETEEKH